MYLFNYQWLKIILLLICNLMTKEWFPLCPRPCGQGAGSVSSMSRLTSCSLTELTAPQLLHLLPLLILCLCFQRLLVHGLTHDGGDAAVLGRHWRGPPRKGRLLPQTHPRPPLTHSPIKSLDQPEVSAKLLHSQHWWPIRQRWLLSPSSLKAIIATLQQTAPEFVLDALILTHILIKGE